MPFLFSVHDAISLNPVDEVLKTVCNACKLKFEGFVMHIRCKTLVDAQRLLAAALAAGFRNSGITLGKKCQNIMVGIRGTLCMEVPLTDHRGKLMVNTDYLSHIINIANTKLNDNSIRIKKLEQNIEKMFFTPITCPLKSKCDDKKRHYQLSHESSIPKQSPPDDVEENVCLLFDDGC